MLKFFETKNQKRTCSICNEFVDHDKIHVILEVNNVPPTLLFFHFPHYKCFLEILHNYFESKNDKKIENFVMQPISEFEQELKMAEDQGFGTDFEDDLSEVRNFIIYKEIQNTTKTEFYCRISKNTTTIDECFKCEMGNLNLCNKCIIFSIKPKLNKFEIKKRI